MQLERLKSLYLSMSAAGLTRIALPCRVSETTLDVAMLAEPGNQGIFIGRDGQWVFLAVTQGGLINPVLPHQDYVRILRMVKAEAQKGVFKTGQFFHELDAVLPDRVETRWVLRTHVAAQLFPMVPEADRLHFLGFQSPIPGASVTEQNLEKTRLLLGAEAYDLCRALNRSSHWSQSSAKAVRILPELAQLRKEAGRPAPKIASSAPALARPGAAPTTPIPDARPLAADTAIALPDVSGPGKQDPAPAPPQTARTPALVLVCGPAGSGKSTFSRILGSKMSRAVTLDLDVFTVPMVEAALKSHDIGLHSPGTAYLVNHLLREGRYAALMSLAFELLSQGYTPVCAFDLRNEAQRLPELREHLASSGLALKVVLLAADEPVRRARITGRGEFWDEYNLRQWDSLGLTEAVSQEGLSGRGVEVLALDTTAADPAVLAEQAAAFVADGR